MENGIMQDFCVILRPRRGRLRNTKKKKVLESKLSDTFFFFVL